MLSAVQRKCERFAIHARDIYLNWIGPDHVACLTEVHLAAMFAGAQQCHVRAADVVVMPTRLLRLAASLRVSYTFAPNFLLEQLLAVPLPQLDLTHLRVLVSGGEGVPTQTGKAVQAHLEKCGARPGTLVAGFGMTETCVSACVRCGAGGRH